MSNDFKPLLDDSGFGAGRTARSWSARLLGVLTLLAAGCMGITVKPVDGPGLLTDWQASAIQPYNVSPRTLQTLRLLDMEPLYQRSPNEAFSQLQIRTVSQPQPDLLFALAEMAYLLGTQAERNRSADACSYYYLCAGYAYHYLFDATPEGTKPSGQEAAVCTWGSPFDPRFRLACDLYNGGLAKCIRAAERYQRLDPRQELHLPAADGKECALSVKHHGFAWRPEEFGPLLVCADYQVVGLDNLYRTYGLGVPLIGMRNGPAEKQGPALYPRDDSFPVTAFFRFEGSLADLSERHAGSLELYNPLTIQTVSVQGRGVPLETDLTTPLAYFLSRTDLEGIEYSAFLNADKVRKKTGIYMFEPYQPGKIPVVMVHGLLSNPLTWTVMFNDLRADPELRDHYQFWFYLYPTGLPYIETAANLRDSLVRLRQDLDPQHQDPALDNLVCVGHSMGGLVSKLLTVDSGNDFWSLVSKHSFDQIKVQPQTRAELQRLFFFERQPFIKRVVFLGTPHHGSKLSVSPVAKLVDKFVQLPKNIVDTAQDVMQENPQTKGQHLPTSVDLLAPGAPALEVLAARPWPPGIHYHSIIGEAPCANPLREVALALGQTRERSDGIVPYSSAHLPGVDSEIVIPADHLNVHRHPLAILEVRRILREHLQSVGR